MELGDYLRVIRRGWLVIVVALLLGAGSAAGYSLMQTPSYQAQARVAVAIPSASIQELASGITIAQNQVATYAVVATSELVLQPVIDQLGLSSTVGELASQVSASAPLNTSIIDITATSPNAAAAARIANAVAGSLRTAVGRIQDPTEATTDPVRLTVIQSAVAPASPTSPRIPLNLALGTLVGLALGVGIAVLRAQLDTRVRGEADASALAPLPVIGSVGFDRSFARRPLVLRDQPSGQGAEAYRAIRTRLQRIAATDGRRSFVITSALAGEGKTTTAANLSLALADAGHRVAVVDADLRHPRLAQQFGLDADRPGLIDYLQGEISLDELPRFTWPDDGPDVIAAGRAATSDASELLSSRAMSQLIARLCLEYDMVLIDAPPALAVTDAAVLGMLSDSALVVAASGLVRRHELGRAIDVLHSVDVDVAGIVLTMERAGRGSYYSEYAPRPAAG